MCPREENQPVTPGRRPRPSFIPIPSPPPIQEDANAGNLVAGTNRNFSYCFNGELNSPLGSRGETRGVRIVQVRHLTEKMLVVVEEGPAFPSSGISSASGTNGVIVFLTKRHYGMCNVCFFDLHVEKLNPDVFANKDFNVNTPAYAHYVDIFSNR